MADMKYFDQSGFTLMEIMLVVIILSVFATVAFIKFDNSVERVRVGEAIQILQTLKEAQEVYKQENGSYTATITNLGVSIPPTQFFNAPQVSDTNVNALATVVRNSANFRFGTAYTLRIPRTGVVTCSGTTFCNQLGF